MYYNQTVFPPTILRSVRLTSKRIFIHFTYFSTIKIWTDSCEDRQRRRRRRVLLHHEPTTIKQHQQHCSQHIWWHSPPLPTQWQPSYTNIPTTWKRPSSTRMPHARRGEERGGERGGGGAARLVHIFFNFFPFNQNVMLHHSQQPCQLSSRAQPAVAVVRQRCAALHKKLCRSHIFVDNGVVQCGRSREIFDTQKSVQGERRKERREERESCQENMPPSTTNNKQFNTQASPVSQLKKK